MVIIPVMLVPAKPSLGPGLLAGAVAPATVLFATVLLSTWVGTGGFTVLTEAAGPFAALVLVTGLAEMAFLTLMLCQTGAGRPVPLAVMLGMATLPWTLGLLGTEVILGRALAALPQLDDVQARVALAAGTGRAMAPRMLGAWTSGVLLVSLAGGLVVARMGLPVEERVRRARGGSLLLGSAVALALAVVAGVGALEAHQLFELLTRLARAPVAERTLLLEDGLAGVMRLRPLRWGGMGVLGVLALALLRWKARGGARQTLEWVGSAAMLAAVGALLILDAHPLRFATQGARAAGLERLVQPLGFDGSRAPGPVASRERVLERLEEESHLFALLATAQPSASSRARAPETPSGDAAQRTVAARPAPCRRVPRD